MEIIGNAKSAVRHWSERHKEAALYDDESTTLLDVASGKRLSLAWRDVTAFEEKIHPDTQDSYLVLLFENGTQIALVDPGGVAFAPSKEHSGPVQNLPPVVCLRDFYTLKQRVDHYLHDHLLRFEIKEYWAGCITSAISTLQPARPVHRSVSNDDVGSRAAHRQ